MKSIYFKYITRRLGEFLDFVDSSFISSLEVFPLSIVDLFAPLSLQTLNCLRFRPYSQLAFIMSSSDNSSSRDEKVRTRVENIIDSYAKLEIQKLYEDLVKLTGKEYEKLLKNINGEDNKDPEEYIFGRKS